MLKERRDDLLNHYGERWLKVWFDKPAQREWFSNSEITRIEQEGETVFQFHFRDSTLANPDPTLVVPQLMRIFRERDLTPIRLEGGRSRLEEIFRKVVESNNSDPGKELRS